MGQIGPLIRIIEGSELVIGFRLWRVYGTVDLRSLTGARERWTPGENFTAHCEGLYDDSIPHCECRCGVYAFRDLSHLSPRQQLHVTGAVALWGRIVEHEHGFRAEHARPVALAESHYAQRVADVYGLPVLSRESLELEAGALV